MLGVFLYAWSHHQAKGAEVYSWVIGGQFLTSIGFIFELISPNLDTKLMWDKFQWLTDAFLVILPFLIFSVKFTETKFRYPKLFWGYWISIPSLFTMLLMTDGIHHLVYPNPQLNTYYPFPELHYEYTSVVYAFALLYIYGGTFYGAGILLRSAFQQHSLYRLQYITIAAGFLLPVLLSFSHSQI